MQREDLREWWHKEGDECADVVCSIVKALDEEQSYRVQANKRNLRLYSNLAVLGLGGSEYSTEESSLPTNRLTLNVVESVVETAKALISTNRPKVRFLTDGGTYSDQVKAKNLTYFTSGLFYGEDVYEKAQEAFGDAAIFGTGFLKIAENDGEMCIERVFPNEIIVDDVEAVYGKPRSLYQHKEIEKSVLLANPKYKKYADKIKQAGLIRHYTGIGSLLSEPCSIVEAWHLPSSPESDDGRHIICIDHCMLYEEDWNLEDFPFEKFSWVKRPMGFYGKGIPEQIRGIQIEINIILQKIQRHMNLASSKVFLPKGGKTNKNQLNNEEWGLIEYTGDKVPVLATIAAISPEYFRQVESLYQKAFEVVGISQMSAQSQKPAGLDSGRAIREYNDIQTQRFLHVGQSWEQFFIRVARKAIDVARKIDSDNGKFSVLAEVDDQLKEFNWKDVDPGKDKYVMKAWPVSFLPDSPAGKLQSIQELLSIDPRVAPYGLQLLQYPDLEAITKRVNAPVVIMDKIIGMILEKGLDGYIQPEPYMDLAGGITQMQLAYLDAKVSNVDPDKLELMRMWMNQARDILMQAQMAMASQQQAQMAEQLPQEQSQPAPEPTGGM